MKEGGGPVGGGKGCEACVERWVRRGGGRGGGEDAGDVASVGAEIEDGRKVATYVKKTFAEARGNFIAEIVDSSATFCVGGCALFLDVFGVCVEDLKRRRTRLNSVKPRMWETPPKGRAWKERS